MIFIDETGDDKFKNYFGVNLVLIDSKNYGIIKNGFQKILSKFSWDSDIEFKGSYIFSSNKGNKNISIDDRVNMVKEIVDLTHSNKNSKVQFFFADCYDAIDKKSRYIEIVGELLNKALNKPKLMGDKNLVSITCDFRQDTKLTDINKIALPVISKKGYQLFEDVCIVSSNNNTIGILLADIIGYLLSRYRTVSNDYELFENLPEDKFLENGKIQKAVASFELIEKIKQLNEYEYFEQ